MSPGSENRLLKSYGKSTVCLPSVYILDTLTPLQGGLGTRGLNKLVAERGWLSSGTPKKKKFANRLSDRFLVRGSCERVNSVAWPYLRPRYID